MDVDRLIRARGVTLRAIRASIPRALLRRSPARAWLGLARAWATVAMGEAALATVHLSCDASLVWRVPLLAAAWGITCAGMVGLFILGHDCGHRAFSRRPWVNALVGHVCMSPILTGFHGWRLAHAHHHARAGLRGDDTDWPERMLTRDEASRASVLRRLEVYGAFGSPLGLLAGFVVGMVRRTLMSRCYPQVPTTPRARRHLAVSNIATVVTSGSIAVALACAGGPAALAKHYLVPLYLGMVLGALFTYLHHSGEGAVAFDRKGWTALRGQIVSSFDVRFPAWFERLFFNINRHPAHHLSPCVPWYHLPAAMRAVVRAYPEAVVERRFSVAYLRRGWGAPLLEPVAPGVYVASGEGHRRRRTGGAAARSRSCLPRQPARSSAATTESSHGVNRPRSAGTTSSSTPRRR